ncbi:MAG: KH domain-containing protein [bacterium]|nr:KH domain-containing protein [bacterium]
MAKIIGREGQTARAIRTLLRIVGIKNNARVNLKIEEPAGGRMPRERGVDEVVEDLKL